MARPTPPINLSLEQNELLHHLARRRETPHSLVLRVQIIRQSAQGINNKTISMNLGLCEDTVGQWRRRWVASGAQLTKCAGKPKELRAAVGKILADQARPGSPGKFSAEQICQLMALACEAPPEHLSHWTYGELVREAVKRGIAETISTSSASRFLKSGGSQTASCQILAQSSS